jgi:hypothetical protein
MKVSLPTDSDGFLSQECPSCAQRFKVRFGEGSSEPVSCCPYCGHRGRDCWYTQQQIEYVQVVAANEFLGPELKRLERDLNRSAKGFLQIGFKADISKPPPPPIDPDDPFYIMHFPCCNEAVKVIRQPSLFCVICGSEINMAASESTKVFLSHKGVDKDMVIDFHKTLAQLGYTPWLDEDAMPAGTALERGLLAGMEESCGVVFFITPNFKDEGFLQTEVDYAIRQKRAKGDRFAIVTLQFLGDDGSVGAIPKLLEGYVWKKPRTRLEALREIVRALPVVPGHVEWREGIDGVVRTPKIKSTTTELSDEAKTILKAAATGGGTIMYVRTFGGETIQAGNRSMIPDKDPRIVARWTGGLEDLQRRRYIKDRGHKGEVFEVTREGYEAADALQ